MLKNLGGYVASGEHNSFDGGYSRGRGRGQGRGRGRGRGYGQRGRGRGYGVVEIDVTQDDIGGYEDTNSAPPDGFFRGRGILIDANNIESLVQYKHDVLGSKFYLKVSKI